MRRLEPRSSTSRSTSSACWSIWAGLTRTREALGAQQHDVCNLKFLQKSHNDLKIFSDIMQSNDSGLDGNGQGNGPLWRPKWLGSDFKNLSASGTSGAHWSAEGWHASQQNSELCPIPRHHSTVAIRQHAVSGHPRHSRLGVSVNTKTKLIGLNLKVFSQILKVFICDEEWNPLRPDDIFFCQDRLQFLAAASHIQLLLNHSPSGWAFYIKIKIAVC